MADVDPKINPPAPTNGPPADPPAPTNGPPAPAPTPAPAPVQPPADDKKGDDDTAARLKAMEEQLRNTGSERDNLKSVLEKLGKVLNPEKETDPEELAKNLSAKDQELAETKLELAVLKIAGHEKGADLLDSRKFMNAVKGLDPNGDAFATKVKEMMGSDKQDDGGKKSGDGKKGKSAGAEMTGGSTGTQTQLTRADLKKMSPEEIEKAESEGRLTALLSGQGA